MRQALTALSVSLAIATPAALLTDVTRQAGIAWTHFNGESPDRYLVESTTGGVGFLDFDGDGLLDVFLVNGGETPKGRSKTPVRHALYRNLGNGRFQDLAAQAGVDRTPFYGMGVAAADYDNDGRTDLYLTGFPTSALFHNEGGGRFRNVTAAAGVENSGEWAASAAWFDYDRDGLLDLFVCNYVEFSFADRRRCEFAGAPAYCAQTEYSGRPPRLFRNQGDGTFRDVSGAAGLARLAGRALGVVSIDADDDGWDDLFVARDASPNLLLINQRNGTFRDAGLEAEVAYSPDGIARAGMGVDAADADGDGRPDFVVTNFDHEYHALYLNTGAFPYREFTVGSLLARHTKPYVGWGVRFLDFDNDGDLDLLVLNGHLHERIALSNKTVSYREPLLLLANDGRAVFENLGARAGPAFAARYAGRSLAAGDWNNDGAVDAAFVSLNEPAVLLRNDSGSRNAWLGVRLQGVRSNRDAIGAKLTLRTGPLSMVRWVTGGGSYQATHDRRVVFGLGKHSGPVDLEIRWPVGGVQHLKGLAPNRYHDIREADRSELR